MVEKMKIYITIKSRWVGNYAVKLILLTLVMSLSAMYGTAFSYIVEDGDKTYIVDRTGEQWDVTQARSIGFSPDRFQYGIGRHTISPLDSSHLIVGPYEVPENLRIIGVTEGALAHAYSVPKLTRHEIANTELGGEMIAVGY